MLGDSIRLLGTSSFVNHNARPRHPAQLALFFKVDFASMASPNSKKRAASPGEGSSQVAKEKKQRLLEQCEWIKSEPAWKTWISPDNQTSPILWIHGPPGCGKTFLAHHIADSLQMTNDQPATVTYFCDAYTSLESIFRSILAQLVREPKLGAITQSMVVESLKDVKEEATVSKLWDSFSSVIRMDKRINLVIDGLDEIPYHQVFNVPARLAEAVSKTEGRLKLLFTSRTESKVRNYFKDYAEILIVAEKVKEDMQRFIDSEVQRYQNLVAFQDEIVSNVLEHSDGNFLCSALWIKALASTVNGNDLTSLDDFPTSLDEIYARILEQNTEILSYPDLDLRDHILRWVVAAIRPIRLTELANSSAIATNSFIPNIESKAAEICGSFVMAQDGVLKPIHYSFLIFLSGKHAGVDKIRNIGSEQANAEIARVCLTYLSHSAFRNFPKGPLNVADAASSHPFLEYATLYWVHHISKAVEYNLELQTLIKVFFSSSNAFIWLDVFLPAHLSRSLLPPPPGRTINSSRFFYVFTLKSRIVNYFSGEAKTEIDEQISGFLRKSYEDELQDARSQYGHESFPAVRRMMDLAEVYGWLSGLKPKATSLLEEALSISSTFSENESEFLYMDVQQALADDYKRGGKYKEAQGLLEKLVATAEKLDAAGRRIMVALDSLGWVCMRLNQFPEAAAYLEQALAIVTKEEGILSPQTLRSKMTLAEVLNKLNRGTEAEVLCAELISQVKEHRENGSALPKDSISQLNTLAAVFVQQGKWRDAIEIYDAVVQDRKSMFGDEHPVTMWAVLQLGKAMQQAGENEQAKSLFEVLLPRQKKNLGEEHPDVKESEEMLASLRTLTT